MWISNQGLGTYFRGKTLLFIIFYIYCIGIKYLSWILTYSHAIWF